VTSYDTNDSDAKCPVPHGTAGGASSSSGTSNNDWWPNQINLEPLLHNNPNSDPYDPDFDYVEEFKTLDLDAVKADIAEVMTTSQDWWPADYGNYGPLFIRMAWHSAGTYRVSDGRGGGGQGLQRFAPLNSWPDNVNLDKARRLLWPVKQKYGRKLSWADLMILAGNVALEDMGFPTFGFAGGRADVWEPDNTYWGNETEWLANKRYDTSRDAETLEDPLAAVQMGLIYVNPEGPDGNPDFKLAAADIRTTFKRMAMNDEETVALIAGGHAFGKTHGAGSAEQVGPEPEAVDDLASVGLGWTNSQGRGNAEDTISSGLEVTWTNNPTRWDNDYLRLIYKYEWEIEESPAGAKQWKPVGEVDEEDLAPHAHLPGVKVAPRMLTTDLALRFGDEEYDRISRKFLEDFDYFTDVFARAWFKLTHRDMGPRARYHGPEVPAEVLLWQDPVQENTYSTLSDYELEELDVLFQDSGLHTSDLIEFAWASASTYRNTDKRGGANGARILLEPQRSWPVNASLDIPRLEMQFNKIKDQFTGDISMADLIVYGGVYAIKKAITTTATHVEVPFTAGRGDATQEQTDVDSFNYLYPVADAFRNWSHKKYADSLDRLLIDKAALLGLTPPEMVALYGGLRSMAVGTFAEGSFANANRALSNDFFVKILDMDIRWEFNETSEMYLGLDRKTEEVKLIGSRADLVFASNSVLRAYAEVYASNDGDAKLVKDFVAAWDKIMTNDRFDIK
jgi:catalase-peroxidase